MLLHVIEYNSQNPTKFAIFPKYGEFVTDYRYAPIARRLDLGGHTQQMQIKNLIKAVRNLMEQLNMPSTIVKEGISEAAFLDFFCFHGTKGERDYFKSTYTFIFSHTNNYYLRRQFLF
jgi:alcohol dehydrogenase class IV